MALDAAGSPMAPAGSPQLTGTPSPTGGRRRAKTSGDLLQRGLRSRPLECFDRHADDPVVVVSAVLLRRRPALQVTRRLFKPYTTLILAGGCSSESARARSGKRLHRAGKATRISIRASGAPRQRCTP